jgi:hypothetical protein
VLIVPVLPPKQLILWLPSILLERMAVKLRAAGWVTLIVDWAVQRLTSVTWTVIAPAPALVTATEEAAGVSVAPEVLTSVVNEYGNVPPAAVKLPEPFVAPLQSKAISPDLDSESTAGCVSVTLPEALHPLLSVTVTA